MSTNGYDYGSNYRGDKLRPSTIPVFDDRVHEVDRVSSEMAVASRQQKRIGDDNLESSPKNTASNPHNVRARRVYVNNYDNNNISDDQQRLNTNTATINSNKASEGSSTFDSDDDSQRDGWLYSLPSSAFIGSTTGRRDLSLGLECSPLLGGNNRTKQNLLLYNDTKHVWTPTPTSIAAALGHNSNTKNNNDINNIGKISSVGSIGYSGNLKVYTDELGIVQMNSTNIVSKFTNIKWIGVLLFILACVFCVYEIIHLNAIGSSSNENPKYAYVTHLKLVNLFNRHGDRAPSDSLPYGDRHREIAHLLWPDGLQNITATGKLRQYRIGLELRRRYGHLIGYDANSVLTFSSSIYRCQESAQETLRGLFDNQMTLQEGLDFIESCGNGFNGSATNNDPHNDATAGMYHHHYYNHYRYQNNRRHCHIPNGSGSPLEWRNISIDINTIPALTYEFLNSCPYRISNPSPVDTDLMQSKSVASLKGLNELRSIIKDRYRLDFNFTALGVWSTLAAEIRLARTRQTYDYGRELYDWVNKHVADYKSGKVTLFDLYEHVVVLSYRDRIVGEANWIQLSPIVSSIIGSQLVALNETDTASINGLDRGYLSNLRARANADDYHYNTNTDNDSNNNDGPKRTSDNKTFKDMFSDKRLIIYSSHDSIMQLLMHRLKLIQAVDANEFEQRLGKWKSKMNHRRHHHHQKQQQQQQHFTSVNSHLLLDYNEIERDNYDTEMFLEGLKMSSFGASLAFELWQIERIEGPEHRLQNVSIESDNGTGTINNNNYTTDRPHHKYHKTRYSYVQALLYNREDGQYEPVVYKPLALGSVCQMMFKEQYPGASLDRFYEFFTATVNDSHEAIGNGYGSGHGINVVDSESRQSDRAYRSASDRALSCPFELFRNVTANLMLDINKMNAFCSTRQQQH